MVERRSRLASKTDETSSALRREEDLIGHKVVVRADRAGVFFGTLTSVETTPKGESKIGLSRARKLFYWDGAGAVEGLATDGVSRPENCNFTVWVDFLSVGGVIQTLKATPKAIKSLEGVKEWKA